MRIVKVSTLRIAAYPNLCYVQLETDTGLTGLGETFFDARAVASWIHDSAAQYLIGEDPLAIERHSRALQGFLGSVGTGVENRGRSAIDMALWDLLGKTAGVPLYNLIGGRTRDSVRLYNTCAGPTYVRQLPDHPDLPVSNWASADPAEALELPSDLEAFLTDAGALAKDLLAEDITAMKIWPFDEFAEKSQGHYISSADLETGVRPFRLIREAVGDSIDVIAELHSKWDLPSALKIAHALEPYAPAWIEDPLRMDSLDALAGFAAGTKIPMAASETIGSTAAFQDLISRSGVQVVLFDPAWVGGITEARKIAAMAAARHLPVAVHDCAGPLNYIVGVHLSCSLSNAFVQESVRAFYRGWYRDIVTELPAVSAGQVFPTAGPGIGAELRPEVWTRSDAAVETTTRTHPATED